MKNKCVIFSDLFLLVLITLTPSVNLPVITLNNDIFPTNGSAIVLNTNAENGLFSSNLTKTSLNKINSFLE